MSSNSKIIARNSGYRLFICVIIISVMLLLSTPVKAGIVWQETFGTTLSDDWTISHGAVQAQNGALEGTECYSFGSIGSSVACGASLWFDSTASTGTWGLDYYLSNTSSSFFFFYFIGEGVSSISGGWPDADYMLFVLGSNYLAVIVF